ncbi:MAG: thiol protease/hemagglutinin PrtT [Bacteroidales bacterium]|nr:thiol protease/hemagglutinin PrtT [Bacteroidales bacterium]
MYRLALFVSLLLLCSMSLAAPVDIKTAQKAGWNFLQEQEGFHKNVPMTLYKTVGFKGEDNQQTNCYYIFNLGDEGFVIVSADDRCAPIIGFSANGSYDDRRLPSNMAAWMKQCAQEIEAGIRDNAPENLTFKKRWDELTQDNRPSVLTPKSNNYLLTSTWEQGYGYNRYCPIMNGYHVVVGCVATAMAQIIRYYQYPSRGFGHKFYVHEAYGQLGVNFDTVDYDYSLMPDEVNYRSDDNVIDMVSRLCYHCGIVVNMTYQHAGHPSGSGAHSEKLPEGYKYFGYTDVEYYNRLSLNNDALWIALIRNEIDNSRPIEYSGANDEGGHAFVLDGYNDNDQYHFNWGWGGYCDGFYTLTTMCGYTSNHAMSINIKPSGWDGHLNRFYVSPDGDGNGTSWGEANSNLNAAIKLNDLVNRDIWIKEGTYFGDTNAEYAFQITNPATLIGGFAGTETTASQRDAKLHPAILDGQGQRSILFARHNSNTNNIRLIDITLQNGYSPTGSCITLNGQVQGDYLVVRNCQSDSGSILNLSDSRVRMSIIEGNQAPTICQLEDGTLRQSLVNNNNAECVLRLKARSRVVNSDIVSNTGTGVAFHHKRNTFINNIVWNNDTTMRSYVELLDTAIRYCGLESDTAFVDSTWVRLSSNNEDGPRFIQTGNRGLAGLNDPKDYRFQRGSICINAGTRLPESILDGDLDHSIRCREGYIDLGCYESNYPVDIDKVEGSDCKVYPNPFHSTITIDNCPAGTIQLYDITGRLILEQECAGMAVLDLSQLPQGIFYLKIGGRSHKIIKH